MMSARQQLTNLTYNELEIHVKGVFDCPTYGSDATERLLTIQQGARFVVDYLVEFWTLVHGSWVERTSAHGGSDGV